MNAIGRTLSGAAAAIVLCFANTPALTSRTFAEFRADKSDAKIESLRKSVERDFEGFGQFDDGAELALSDLLAERTKLLPCRGLPEVLAAVRIVFPRFELHEFSVSRQYPRNGVYFRRISEANKTRDIVNFYFVVEKNPGVECNFTFGAFARSVMDKKSKAATTKDKVFEKLLSDISSAITEIEADLAAPRKGALFAPTRSASQVKESIPLKMLRARKYGDHITNVAVQRAMRSLGPVLVDYGAVQDDIEVLIVKFESTLPREIERYRTANCIAVPYDFARPTIICSAHYLAEIEAVLRFFENAELGIRSTQALRRLARDFSRDSVEMLAKLRSSKKIMGLTGQDREHVIDHLSQAAMFLLAHEIGHLMSSTSTAAMDDNAVVATSGYRAAILRLCKHADQFKQSDFRLDLMDSIVMDPSSANRAFIDRFRALDKRIEVADENFREEVLADSFGTDFTLRYFVWRSQNDLGAAELEQYWFLENIEALATYFWYKSYFQFADAICNGVKNSSQLSHCLGMSPENWVAAADVFGRFHRNIFLRAIETFAAFVSERTNFYHLPLDDRIVVTYEGDEALEALPENRRGPAIRLTSILQRHFMLRELVDTPLKLAFTGCTLGWARELRGGTAPLMLVNFLSYEEEMQRFQRKLWAR